MGRRYIQTITGLILALVFLTAVSCSDKSENCGEIEQTQEIEEMVLCQDLVQIKMRSSAS